MSLFSKFPLTPLGRMLKENRDEAKTILKQCFGTAFFIIDRIGTIGHVDVPCPQAF